MTESKKNRYVVTYRRMCVAAHTCVLSAEHELDAFNQAQQEIPRIDLNLFVDEPNYPVHIYVASVRPLEGRDGLTAQQRLQALRDALDTYQPPDGTDAEQKNKELLELVRYWIGQ